MSKLDKYEKKAGLYIVLIIGAAIIFQIEHGNFDKFFWESFSFCLIFIFGILMGYNAGLSDGRKLK